MNGGAEGGGFGEEAEDVPAGVGEVEEVARVREDAGAVEELAGNPFLVGRGRAAQEGGPAGFAGEDAEAGRPGNGGKGCSVFGNA